MLQYLTAKSISIVVGVLILLIWIIGIWWSYAPATFDVNEHARLTAQTNNQKVVTGYTTTTTLIKVTETLLNKSGGYISNDIFPPGVLLDNMPNWEFGALEMSRDLILSMRKDFSRSQSQSQENERLKKAQPLYNIDNNNWILPSSESQYRKAIDQLYLYQSDLSNAGATASQFYARADNLRDWLKQVEKRLGSISQNLSASVGSDVIDTSLAGDAQATKSTSTSPTLRNKTGWWKLDDNFYEARGASWALLHFLRAIETDFEAVLEKKNALISLRQIIRELEATQAPIYSPMVLNGDGFGMLANHSLVMANYISRANAALIELSELLNQG